MTREYMRQSLDEHLGTQRLDCSASDAENSMYPPRFSDHSKVEVRVRRSQPASRFDGVLPS